MAINYNYFYYFPFLWEVVVEEEVPVLPPVALLLLRAVLVVALFMILNYIFTTYVLEPLSGRHNTGLTATEMFEALRRRVMQERNQMHD
jgi:uncharacterized membrane protein YdbT with pleckstrin-like domain